MKSTYHFHRSLIHKGFILVFMLVALFQNSVLAQNGITISTFPFLGDPVTYSIIPTGCSNTTWSVSGTSHVILEQQINSITVVWTAYGIGTVSVSRYCGVLENYSVSSNIGMYAPEGLRQVGNSCNSISFAWNSVYDATGYYLDVASDINFLDKVPGYDNLQIGKVTSYEVNSGLISNSDYYVRIRAYNAHGPGDYSTTVKCVTEGMSSSAEASPGSGATTTQITANWKTSSGAVKYYLDVSLNSSFTSYLTGYKNRDVGNVLSTTITGLASGTTYYYRVRCAVPEYFGNGNCISRSSNTVEYPTCPSAPVAPSISSNSCGDKTLTKGNPPTGVTWYWQGTNANGTSTSNTATNYIVSSSGTYYLRGRNNTTMCWGTSTGVVVTVNPIPSAPSVISVSTNTCGNKTLTRGNPPTGVTWYWQGTNPNGTSTTNSANTYTATVTGTYYLRARNNTSLCWSSSTGTTVTVNPLPPNPTAPTVSPNSCGNKTLTSGTPPVGITWYWQGTNPNATITEMPTTTFVAYISGTYYLRARNNTTLCWGASTGTDVTVNPIPVVNAGPNLLFFVDNPATVLTGGSPTGGIWSGTGVSGILFSPSNAGTGTHTITYSYTSNGCTASDNRLVSVLAKPTITIYSPNTYLSRGGTVALTTDIYYAGCTYQWYKDDEIINGATSKNYLVAQVGSYKVRVTLNGAVSFSAALRIGHVLEEMSGNYIRSTTVRQAGVTQNDVVDGLAIGQVNEQISYFDGLGRPMQNVQVQGSPLKKDIVQPIIYDQFGREPVKYLPYVSSESSGWYKANPVGTVSSNGLPGSNYNSSPQFQFYNNTGTSIIAHDPKPYAATVIEPSPLNRVLKQGAPGEVWQPDPDIIVSDRSIKFDYKANVVNEVYQWELIQSGYPKIASTRYYGANQLFKSIIKDEHNNMVIEYKDKRGQVILKKVQVDSIPAENTHVGWACTYYIYDDSGNLRYVFPPEMTKMFGDYLVANYLVPTAHLWDWAFQYKYDYRKRMSHKKVPGAEWVYMVYDNRDRLVLTQDAEQRESSQWTFIKYDQLNRPVLTGLKILYFDEAQEHMQAIVNDYYIANPGKMFEIRINHSNGSDHGYTDQSYPSGIENNEYLTVTYYDNYNYNKDGINIVNTDLSFPDGQSGYYINNMKLDNPKGQVTGGKVRNLNDSTLWYSSAVYYDNKYRPIYSVAQNHLSGGYDKTQMQYDFVGNLENSRHVHSATGNPTVVVNKQLIYDHANRLLEVKQKIGDTGNEVIISKNGYNELGELVTKKLHSTDVTNYKQTVDYRYNIRGWLTSINDPNNVDINGGDYFGMVLKYNDPLAKTQLGSVEQFNGNISEIHWKNAQDNTRKTYGINYDNLNRLTKSNYAEGTAYNTNKGFYNENIGGYDYNGNILSLTRSGNGTSTAFIDNLTYTYTGTGIAKSNKLISVSDAASITEKHLGFKDGNTSQDYFYDSNGNLTKDLNKGITSIAYNHLNLPKLITKGDSTIQYVYDASGIKLQKKVSKNGTVVKTTDYIGALVYEGTTDKFLNTEEGRVVLRENGQEKEEYQYHLKDHLGNVRVTFTTADREEMTSMYLLTMEPEFATLEGETFGNLETRQVDVLNNKTEGGKASARLNAFESRVIGPSMSLKVMPGDTIKMNVFAKYDMKAKTKDAVTGMAAIVASSFVTEEMAPEAATIVRQALQAPLSAAQTTLFAKDHTIPKAYLNYLFFDKNMKYKTGGFKQVSEEALGKFEEMELDFAPQEEGYLMVYVANQTNEPLDVFFDQMAVEHTSGPIIRVDDYYPFGMAFNTGTLAGALTNKYLYQGKEIQNELGLDTYDFHWRMYDPAIGRTFQLDPHADKYSHLSAYSWVANNPLNVIDPDGRDFRVKTEVDEEKKNGTITISTNIYVIGSEKDKKKVESYNEHAKKNFKEGTYEQDGVTYTIKFDVNYIYAEKSPEKLAEGDNILILADGNAGISQVPGREQPNGDGTSTFYTGNKGQISKQDQSKETTFHESMHFLGLTDRYDEVPNTNPREITPHKGFSNDVMGSRTSGKISQIHYNNWGKAALEKGNGTIRTRVDLDKSGKLIGGN